MKKLEPSLGIAQFINLPGCRYEGDPQLRIDSASVANDATASTVIFLEQERLFEEVQSSSAGLIITTQDFAQRLPGRNLLICDKPYFTMMALISHWLAMAPDTPAGIHPTAVIAPDADVSSKACIAAGVTIGPHSVIGDGCHLMSGVQIGENVRIGAGTVMHPHAVVYDDCVIGKEVIIHSCAVIGADGFGFALIGDVQQKIPQIGNVEIHDFVEIGANTCVDRATLGSTVIGEGSKLDNLVQIGHNCVIGKHCIICAQVGLAGSTTLGDYVYLAGQVGAAGHLKIGDRAMVGAQSGITNDIPEDSQFLGTPAMEAGLMKRIMASQKRLPDIYRFYMRQIKD
ncbi:MAG: UDP-3-O-(3-hydroxymyristoyl)glucosamine N-acyltransferase [Candidatus Cloacimonetes bacterium]|nr:UDP-3-O-(3-hydroxymyristoyl)glucosamine N-acyltransferase [Candidatus Cloacimonadota bacterium]